MINPKSIGILKFVPTDFIVSEANVFSFGTEDKFNYYILRKCNYTTFEAIEILSDFYKLPSKSITYSGLKDEDGITEQFISLQEKLSDKDIYLFNNSFDINKEKYINLMYYRPHNHSLNVGELCGNNFRIIVRGLDKSLADYVFLKNQISYLFVNYYGTQRFGLPNQDKETYLIGKYIIDREYGKALELFSKQENNVGYKAKEYKNNPECFFESFDKRQLAFYQSSFYSYKWNNDVIELLKKQYTKDDLIEYYQDKIKYIIPCYFVKNKFKIIGKGNFLPHTRVRVINDKIIMQVSKRQVMTQLNVVCLNKFKDDFNIDSWAIELFFFLPAGSYATVAIEQLMISINSKIYGKNDKTMLIGRGSN